MPLIEKIARRKKKEYAPGIPSRKKTTNVPSVKKPKLFGSVIQEHQAERAGKHYDLRLADPKTGIAHSWAIRYLPKPGEKRLAIQQPDHTEEYMTFQGEIPAGYGKGKVRIHSFADAEVVESSPDKVIFNRYVGRDTHEYVMIRTSGNKWIIMNRTPTGEKLTMPESKPRYRELKPHQVDPDKPGQRWDAKIDGAHLLYDIQPGKQIRAFSYRKSKRGPALIQHTYRIPGLIGKKAPRNIKPMLLRGEVYAIDPKTKRAILSSDLGSLLNSNVIKSRRLQKEKGKLINTIFDIIKYEGRDVSDLPTEEKRKLIKDVLNRKGIKGLFHTPPSATTPAAKKKLFEKIRAGKLKQTKEGIIIHTEKGMTKVKFKPEWDIRIKGIFTKKKGRARGMAGGFYYDEVDGVKLKRSARVGTGFSHELRRAMLENPDDFENLIVKVTGMEQHRSGAIRAPSFVGWHLDKNDPDLIPEIKR